MIFQIIYAYFHGTDQLVENMFVLEHESVSLSINIFSQTVRPRGAQLVTAAGALQITTRHDANKQVDHIR